MSRRRKMSMQAKRDIAKRMSAARMTAGVDTTEKMADKLGIAAPTYRRYERGEVVPDLELIAMFADATGYTLDWLIAGHGTPTREKRSRQSK